MSSIVLEFICLIIGILFGACLTYISYHQMLTKQNDLIDDYRKGIDIHNKRETKLVFVNQSIKLYVTQQLNIIKNKYPQTDTSSLSHEELLAAGSYTALKEMEYQIKSLEQETEKLQK